MNVITYRRVSTTEQADSGLGLAAQEAALTAAADAKGWTLVEQFVDAGATGSNVERPGLQAALLALRRGHADALAVSKLDRLSRSLVDFAGLMAQAKKEGWALIALDVGVDTSTPSGALIANVMASFAEFERAVISQRTKDALAALKAQGVTLGRPVVVSPSTAALIARERGAGATWRAVAAALNAAGIPTAHGGARWYSSTVRAIHRRTERQAVAA